MKKIDTKEVVKWVMEQPDDRTVDMGESHWSPEDKNFNCGCVMVQYGREVLGFEESFGCGISSWFTVGRKFSSLAGMDNNIFKVARKPTHMLYGNTQSRMDKRHLLPELPKSEREKTPPAFAAWLVELAEMCRQND